MSLDNFLNQTCVIDRPTANGVDRYNLNRFDMTRVGNNIACRLIEKDMRVVDLKSAESTWVLVTMIILPAGTNIEVNDQVTIDDGTKYLVRKPLERKRANSAHHVSAMVERLNG